MIALVIEEMDGSEWCLTLTIAASPRLESANHTRERNGARQRVHACQRMEESEYVATQGPIFVVALLLGFFEHPPLGRTPPAAAVAMMMPIMVCVIFGTCGDFE
jgi:hypothetical protein